jgi:putative PIN family toxin of toxin-antitoxin system
VRIVFDTNVLFAAFVAHGIGGGLYEECLLKGRIVVSKVILEELREKLFVKAKLTATEVGEVLSAVESDAEIVDVSPLEFRVCRDSDDDWVLATARSGSADALVTGDKDLLVLGGFDGIPILTPRECLGLLRRA